MPRKTRATPSTCKVCGADALYSYYGATACLSCKMFFKRYGGNAQMPVCDFDGHCQVNTNTRHVCPACRLLKCFQVGMRSEMLRGTRAKQNSTAGPTTTVTASSVTNSQSHNRQLGIVNLLGQDQSQLNVAQRTYLSNLIHSCDNRDALSAAKDFLQDLNNRHPRLRFKVDSPKMLALATVFYQAAETFIRSNQDLASFPSRDRAIVVRNAMDNVGVLLGGFLARQSNLIADSAYRNILEQTYGTVPYRFTILSISLLDDDINLVKLALATFALCTNDCTLFDGNIPRVYLSNNQATVRLQHVYAELTWRYLLYTCTFDQAVVRFSRLVRCMCAALTVRIHLQTVNNHTDVIAPLIDELGKQQMEDLDDG